MHPLPAQLILIPITKFKPGLKNAQQHKEKKCADQTG
jgi:hypothetical protein